MATAMLSSLSQKKSKCPQPAHETLQPSLFLVTALVSHALPNFVIIFNDDMGYADLGCFGADKIKTPRVDQMAKEGRKFTSFYVASAVCSASRAPCSPDATP